MSSDAYNIPRSGRLSPSQTVSSDELDRLSRPSDSSTLALLQQDFRVAQPKLKLILESLGFATRDDDATGSR